MVLNGAEVKSLRAGRANLKDGYAKIDNGELYLYNVHISPYSFATHNPTDPVRFRKLLLHKREIRKLIGKRLMIWFRVVNLMRIWLVK